jgi:hypothetical protein
MSLFSVLSIVVGVLMVISMVVIIFFRGAYLRLVKKIYGDQRPLWMSALAVLSILLALFVWYEYLILQIPYGIVLVLLMTMSIAKCWQILFNYRWFRDSVIVLIERDGVAWKAICVLTLALGVILIYLGIAVY